jgi:integrase
MATGRINKSTVDGAHPRAKDWLLWDDKLPGFGLKVTPSGSKVFVFQYRIGGRGAKVRRYTLGKFGRLTPDAARRDAEELARLIAKGIDPQAQKATRARQAIDLAFKPYSARFVAECLKVKWKSSHAAAEAHLRLYAIPKLGNKPLPDINRDDIKAVLKPLKGKSATASYLFAVLRRLFRWAISEGDLIVSPLDGMEPPPVPESRDRVLADAELALVWRASESLGYPFGPFIHLLIVTGARRDEVADLDWAELSRENRIWSLPAARAKNTTAASSPLSALAVAELDALALRAGKLSGWPRKGLVFSTTGNTGISGFSRAKSRLDKRVSALAAHEADPVITADWRLHDLRRTLATGMQRLGVRFEVTEAILNHVSGSRSGVAGIYQRHDWGPEKVTALQAWSDHIKAILSDVDKSNVVPLASVRA